MMRPNVETMIEEKVKDMTSAKVHMSMRIMWKEKIGMGFKPDAIKKKTEGSGDSYIRVDKPFYSNLTLHFLM